MDVDSVNNDISSEQLDYEDLMDTQDRLSDLHDFANEGA